MLQFVLRFSGGAGAQIHAAVAGGEFREQSGASLKAVGFNAVLGGGCYGPLKK
jgi:hypothetical protein